MKTIEDVKNFWENYPLFTGESRFEPGTKDFFEEHKKILLNDAFSGNFKAELYIPKLLPKDARILAFVRSVLHRLHAGLKGRGREDIFLARDSDEMTRLYDSHNNPIGKCYSRGEIIGLVKPFFIVEKTFLQFFPCRALPFYLPKRLHSFLAKRCGFMINLHLKKK